MSSVPQSEIEFYHSLLAQARQITAGLKRRQQRRAFTDILGASRDLHDFEVAWSAMDEKDYDHERDLWLLADALVTAEHIEKSRQIAGFIVTPLRRVRAFAAIYRAGGDARDLDVARDAVAVLAIEGDDTAHQRFIADIELARCGDSAAAMGMLTYQELDELSGGGGFASVFWTWGGEPAEIASAITRTSGVIASRAFAAKIPAAVIRAEAFAAIYRISRDPGDLVAAKRAAQSVRYPRRKRMGRQAYAGESGEHHSDQKLPQEMWNPLDAYSYHLDEQRAWVAVLEVAYDRQATAALQRIAARGFLDPELMVRCCLAEYRVSKDSVVLETARRAANYLLNSVVGDLKRKGLDALLRICEAARSPRDLHTILGAIEHITDPPDRIRRLCELAKAIRANRW